MSCDRAEFGGPTVSMLNFCINRADRDLDTGQGKVLNEAKDELRSLFKKIS